jgi:long-chain acyl-CoA synthetase
MEALPRPGLPPWCGGRDEDPMTSDHLGRTIHESGRRFASQPAMRVQGPAGWRSITYAELGVVVRAAAAALVAAGVAPGDRVGIFSPNRAEWTMADAAILSVGAVTVPIYATNTTEQAAYVVRDAAIGLLFVGGQQQLDRVVEFLPTTPSLERLVVLDPAVELPVANARHWDDFLAQRTDESADEAKERLANATADDLATIVYTSGTTGEPKGVMLTHANVVHQLRALEERFDVGPGDSSLCFLPLSHVYERGWTFHVLSSGAENCYLSDPRAVVAAMAEVRPTLMVSVPRLYEKVHAAVVDQVDRGSAVKARLFAWALRVGGEFQRQRFAGGSIAPLLRAQHAVADRLVLAKVRDAVGGEKKVFSAGGAPLSSDIEEFFFAAGLFIAQGYGLTETAAMLTCNYPGAFRFGSVGTPVRGTEFRVAGDGELQVRGGNVMTGYWGRSDDTAAAFADGWFRTGDVGRVDDDGFVFVTDRIKDILNTAQGKNVAPQHVEGVLSADPYIEQVVVFGDRRPYLTALIEPAFPLVERFADERGLTYSSGAELVALPQVRALFDERLSETTAVLAGYEQVKRYHLVAAPFSQESDEMTPTLKLKRRVLEREYAGVLDDLYAAPQGAGSAPS